MTIPPLSTFGRFSPLSNTSGLINKRNILGKIHSPVERHFSQSNISQVDVANPEILAQLKQFKTNPSSCPPWIRVTEEKDGSTWLAFDHELSWKFANPASIHNDGVVTTPFSGFHPITHEFFPPPEPDDETIVHHSVTNTLVKESEGGKRYEPLTPEEKHELDEIANGTLYATVKAVRVEDHNELVAEKGDFLFGLFGQENEPKELTATVKIQGMNEPAEDKGDFLFGFLRQENEPKELTATVKIQGMNEPAEDAPKQPIFLTSTVTGIPEEEAEPELGPEMSYLSWIRTPWDQPDELLLEPLSVETPAVMYLTAQ